MKTIGLVKKEASALATASSEIDDQAISRPRTHDLFPFGHLYLWKSERFERANFAILGQKLTSSVAVLLLAI